MSTDISYIVGDSQRLSESLGNSVADVVFNIESSHCYPSIDVFFAGVCKVLKPGGIFIYADFRFVGPTGTELVEESINRQFEIVKYEDITKNVFHSLEL